MNNSKLVHLVCPAVFILISLNSFAQNISTFAGCGIGDDSIGTKAEVIHPFGIATDNAGNTYIGDYDNNLVRKVDASGIITTFAGTGIYGHTGDGGPATNADIGNIYGVAVDGTGNVYISDINHSLIREINTSGIISTIAGIDDNAGYNGDDIPANIAKLNYPGGLTVDTAGNLYIADIDNNSVRKISTSGIITTVAGSETYGYSGMGGPATAAEINYPYHVKFDRTGNLFITDEGNNHVYKVSTTGIITNYAGNGGYGYSGDGGPATNATIKAPSGLAVDTFGNVYFSDLGNSRVRMISAATGIVTTVYGNGTAGFSGDGGPAIAAELSSPRELTIDKSGNFLIADEDNNRVRTVSPAGVITTLAGRNGLFGEGYAAGNAELSFVQNMATDAAGNLYFADFYNQRVRMINAATGMITTVAGSGISGNWDNFSGDGGQATAAHLYYPSAVAFDPAGNMFICDQDNNRIREVTTSGIITTIAGTGTAGYVGDGSPATNLEINTPSGIVSDKAGNIYIADRYNHRVRMISPSGTITTVAGTGTNAYGGDGGPAVNAELSYPSDVAFDGMGNLYICDNGNNVIRMVDTAGNISTVAGNNAYGFSGDGGVAIDAKLADPYGIKVDSVGDIIIADHDNMRIRAVNAAGIIYTIAGIGTPGFAGDGGPAVDAELLYPAAVAFDNSGNLYIADGGNHRVRKTSLITLAAPQVQKTTPAVFVYPNPTVGMLNIANGENGTFMINDVYGKALMSGTITSYRQEIDISSFSAGVYLLQITGNNGDCKIEKIIKE